MYVFIKQNTQMWFAYFIYLKSVKSIIWVTCRLYKTSNIRPEKKEIGKRCFLFSKMFKPFKRITIKCTNLLTAETSFRSIPKLHCNAHSLPYDCYLEMNNMHPTFRYSKKAFPFYAHNWVKQHLVSPLRAYRWWMMKQSHFMESFINPPVCLCSIH